MSKIALITGATSGIGEAVAYKLAEKGYDLIITGRRESRLQGLSHELCKSFPIRTLPLSFDVRVLEDVEKYILNLPQDWKDIDVLVNNAGLAVGLNTIDAGIYDDWDRMIDTNIKGLLYMTKVVSNLMIPNKKGHIINLCSIAGKEVYPNGNVYCATKHAVDAITKSTRIDLLPHNIRVSQICPGAVETEFSEVRFKGDKDRAAMVYKGFEPLKAEDIANAILFMIECPPHVNINDMVIMPTAQANSSIFNKKL